MELRRSPLDSRHRALGAKMGPFGGWEMPLSYPDGTIAEHEACRHGAAVFDVSHLGTVRVQGPGAHDLLQRTLTNDLRRIGVGRAQYTHLLDDSDGSVLDDIIIWWVDEELFDVMPNASNTDGVTGALDDGTADVEDVTASRAVIAVQGPEARQLVSRVCPEAVSIGRFEVARFVWEGTAGVVAGTGYTGEDGFECVLPADAAPDFWDAVTQAGVVPAGLGARDTLRLEAGLPLHGHELGPGITPLQAGLGWVVAWDKPQGFPGREALANERETGPSRVLTGLVVEGRRPPRQGQAVVLGGEVVGEVTSGNFSPELGCGVALAFVAPGIEPGIRVGIDARGNLLDATVVKPPFVKRDR